MALSESAKTSLAGIWGGYDFYLIRDDHFQTASEMVERFLELNLPRWRRLVRPGDAEFLSNLSEVRAILMLQYFSLTTENPGYAGYCNDDLLNPADAGDNIMQ
jgi:hypothetical protein